MAPKAEKKPAEKKPAGLSFYTTDEELKDVFSPFGNVQEARLMRDHQTGRMKAFGFVKYTSQAEALKAVEAMDGRVYGYMLSVLLICFQ
ncbi:hypothetical protein HU200_044648 [Digitaria exilis]|uniref:RRM domain-containing protein n=1 Tax=Digitaria exilis TaxID=1010633 RepID=A0A835EAZ1_9POAL|nr:hypothetical protein HU200_044648 [Digitaria exilis]